MPPKISPKKLLEKKRDLKGYQTRFIDLKTLELVPPDVDWDSEPLRCYWLNESWSKLVMGWVSWLTEQSVWLEATDERYTGIQAIISFMQGGECCDMIDFRQNPLDTCILQYSTDSGQTWQNAFNFGECLAPIEASLNLIIASEQTTQIFNNQQNINDVYNNYVENYVNSITDIHPELGYQADGKNANRNDALCHSLAQFVDVICELAIKTLDELQDAQNDAVLAIALGIAVIGALAILTGGTGLALAPAIADLAVMGAAVGIANDIGKRWIDFIHDKNVAAYQDTDARAEVVCCAYNNLKNADVDRDDFAGAFDGCGNTQAEQAIAGACAYWATEADVYYANFVENMSLNLTSSELGLLPSCTCEEWCHTLDFRSDSFNPDIIRSGQWVQDSGWVHTDYDAGGIPHVWERGFDVEWDVDNGLLPDSLVCTKIEAYCTYEADNFSGGTCDGTPALRIGRNDFFSGFIHYPSTRIACGEPFQINGQDRKTVKEGTYQFWHTGSPQKSTMRIKMMSSRNTSSTYGGSCVIHKLVLYGTGSKPTFGSGDDC